MTVTTDAYGQLTQQLRENALFDSCASLLGWDEQTYLPPEGAVHRAEQKSLMAGLAHQRFTSPRLGDLLAELEQNGATADPDSRRAANIREARRDYDRSTKLPQRLVEELSRVRTLSQQAWISARKADDYAQFQPWLEQIVTLKREEAQAVGSPTGLDYDGLLDAYEPGATSAEIDALFTPLRKELVELVAAIRDSGVEPPVEILTREYPVDAQREFGLQAAGRIGFDFDAGRLDVAAHPFCSDIGPGDCRLTTRYDEHHFPGAFFGTLHEAGHGIYEQGLTHDDFGLATGYAASLGIHESQSRMWENLVGRSRAFWSHFYEPAQQAFPTALGKVDVETFYAAINDVRPSLIRVEADEVTYNLHIMLRFAIERDLIAGELSAAELPGAWNDAFARDFGITPPSDADGCMQDVHWSAGLIGYFPTYALGNMYAAQFYDQAKADLGDLPGQFAAGDFAPLKGWLNKKIHAEGRRLRANRLVEHVTGKELSHEPLMRQLNEKFRPLYKLS